jgi:hypothetical protein
MILATDLEVFTPDSPVVRTVVAAVEAQLREPAIGSMPRERAVLAGIHELTPSQTTTIANCAFWASVAAYEDRPVRGRLCVAEPHEGRLAIALDAPLPLSVENTVALAIASPGGAVAIHANEKGQPEIWGVIKDCPDLATTFTMFGPAMLRVSVGSSIVAVVHRHAVSLPKGLSYVQWPLLVAKLLNSDEEFPERMLRAARMRDIVAAMCSHGHGGTVMVVPREGKWRDELEIRYPLAGPEGSSFLADHWERLKKARSEAPNLAGAAEAEALPAPLVALRQEALGLHEKLSDDAHAQVGALTALDGAVVIREDLVVVGFGVKLPLAPGSGFDVDEVDLISGSAPRRVTLSKVGGTRHQSVANFVHQNTEAMAFVASQDGNLTLFAWARNPGVVVAVRRLEYVMSAQ